MVEYLPDEEPVRVRRSGGVLASVHALFGAFAAAYFLIAFLMDIAYVQTAYWMWEYFSIWLITAGLIAGVLAVPFGVIAWLIRRRLSLWYGLITALALLLALLNAFIHSRDGWTAVVPEGIILSGVTTLLMLVAAYLAASSSMRDAA